MRKWSNSKHEEALFRRRVKNEERKYLYEPEVSTGYNITSGSPTATAFDNQRYVRRRKSEDRS